MQLAEFIDQLMPGDASLGAPCFTVVAWQRLQADYSGLCAQVDMVLDNMKHAPDASDVDDALARHTALFYKHDADLYLQFREIVLGLYFSSPQVLAAMGEATDPLFPRGQSLSDNDYGRLETVYNRGKIWRDATGE